MQAQIAAASAILLFASCAVSPARAGDLRLSLQAQQALDRIYRGDPDAGISAARDIERAEPQNPVGFLLEGEAEWWKSFCDACEIKWGQFDAWHRGKKPEDEAYFRLADKAIDL